MDFKSWVIQFKDDNNFQGDLAKDINDDEDFPRTNDDREIIHYLRMGRVPEYVIDMFRDVWRQYERSRCSKSY